MFKRINIKVIILGLIALFSIIYNGHAQSREGEILKKAGKYLQNGKYDEAITEYNNVLVINPNCKNAYYGRGISYGKKNNLDQAISNFNKAIELDPKDAD